MRNQQQQLDKVRASQQDTLAKVEKTTLRMDVLVALFETCKVPDITQISHGKLDSILANMGPITVEELENFPPYFVNAIQLRQQKLGLVRA
jgi:hypothetical protein